MFMSVAKVNRMCLIVRDEEVVDSNPATPTEKYQVNARPRARITWNVHGASPSSRPTGGTGVPATGPDRAGRPSSVMRRTGRSGSSGHPHEDVVPIRACRVERSRPPEVRYRLSPLAIPV